MRVDNCVFVDTPRECRYVELSKCLASENEQLQCVFNHFHLKIATDIKKKLIGIFAEELNSDRRHKDRSGEAGRLTDAD